MSEGRGRNEPRIELLGDLARQAVESFRGYAYQVRQTVRAWLKCKSGEDIYCELAEDVDKVRRDAHGQITDAELNQIKHQAGAITLNSAQATQTIENFVRNQSRNPSIRISMRLWTISARGNETGQIWAHADNGLDLWEKLQKREATSPEALRSLRRFLGENPRLSTEVHAFIESLTDDASLDEFVDRIYWDTGQQSYLEDAHEFAWPRNATDR